VQTYELETRAKLAVINQTAKLRSASHATDESSLTDDTIHSNANETVHDISSAAKETDSNVTSELLALHDEPGANMTLADSETSTSSADLLSSSSGTNTTKSTIDPIKEILKHIDIVSLNMFLNGLTFCRENCTTKFCR
jgi:hypothetical protein